MEILYSAAIDPIDQCALRDSILFRNWKEEVSRNFELKRVRFDSADFVTRKGARVPLFIKLRAMACAPDGHCCDQVVVLRGRAVAVLVVLFCDRQPYLLVVDQPRLAIGQRHFLEIVAGILDWSDDSRLVAVEELREEAGIEADPQELVLLSEGLSTSCGLLDEFVVLYVLERDVDADFLRNWQDRKQTYILENEGIRTRIIPYAEGERFFRDTKGIAALFYYERWLKSQGRELP